MGELVKYKCNNCGESATVIRGGTMAADIEQMICNSCTQIVDVTTYYRRNQYWSGSEKQIREKVKKMESKGINVCPICNGHDLILWDRVHCPKCMGEMKRDRSQGIIMVD